MGSPVGWGQNCSFGPKTALNVPVTGERGFAAVTLPLVALRRWPRRTEAKLNDIVLALCGGALQHLAARGDARQTADRDHADLAARQSLA